MEAAALIRAARTPQARLYLPLFLLIGLYTDRTSRITEISSIGRLARAGNRHNRPISTGARLEWSCPRSSRASTFLADAKAGMDGRRDRFLR
jgi:hypothetical protein